MNAEKKQNLEKMKACRKVLENNRKLNKVNIIVLAFGALLYVLHVNVGYYILWTSIGVFIYTGLSSTFAGGALRTRK